MRSRSRGARRFRRGGRGALAAVPGPPRGGCRRRGPPARGMGRRQGHGRSLEDADPRPRALEPRGVGRPGVRDDGDLVAPRRQLQARALRRGHGVRRHDGAPLPGAEPRPDERRGPVDPHCVRRGAAREAAHQGHLRERLARHRRPVRRRLLRLAGALRLRPGRQPEVEARPRADRRRRLRRPGLRVGHGELAHPVRGPGDRAVRPAEGLVRHGLAAPRRRNGLADGPRRAALLGHAHRVSRPGRARARDERAELHSRLRPEDRQGALAARPQLEDHGAHAGVRRRPRRRDERSPSERPHLRAEGRGEGRHHPCPRGRPRAGASPGRGSGRGPTCRRPSSTRGSSTC